MPTSPAERTIVISAPFLAGGVAVALTLLAVPSSWSLLAVTTAHLAALVAMGLVLAVRLAPLVAEPWFSESAWSQPRRRLAAAATLIAVIALVVGLVTLATSAALRLQPSLQFLQLISALDIAWAAAALVIGVWLLRGGRAAWVAGTLLGVVCVAALWNYLRVVGFETDGGWLVDGSRLWTLVIPADMVAATVAVITATIGLRRLDQPMAQASDQS